MSISPVGVTNAYNNIQKISSQLLGSAGQADKSANPAGGAFGDMVADAIKEGVSTIKNTENVASSAITGKASVSDVVNAVNSADIALKTIVTVRDKVIGAYQDIIKMPI